MTTPRGSVAVVRRTSTAHSYRKVGRAVSAIGTYSLLAVFGLFALFPLYWMLVTAIRPAGEVLGASSLLPDAISADWSIFGDVLTLSNKPLLLWMANSMYVAAGSALISVGIGGLGGYALSRFHGFRENRSAGTAILVARLLPPVLLIVPMYVIFSGFGLINSLSGLILANTAYVLPFVMWMLKSFFDTIPVDLEDSAMIDGCNRLQALWHVIVPIALPGIAATTIFVIVDAWTEYLYASVLVRGNNLTVTVGLTTYIQEYTIDWKGLMAACLIGVIPLVAAYIALERHLVQGLAAGSVKG